MWAIPTTLRETDRLDTTRTRNTTSGSVWIKLSIDSTIQYDTAGDNNNIFCVSICSNKYWFHDPKSELLYKYRDVKRKKDSKRHDKETNISVGHDGWQQQFILWWRSNTKIVGGTRLNTYYYHYNTMIKNNNSNNNQTNNKWWQKGKENKTKQITYDKGTSVLIVRGWRRQCDNNIRVTMMTTTTRY